MLRLVRTKLQPPGKLIYKHGLSQLRALRASTRAYSEASDHSEACRHSEAGDVNLDVRMMAIETEVKDVKTELKDFKTEIRDFNKEIFHKIDILGITFEKTLDSYAHDHKHQLSSYALDYKEQLASYAHSQQKEFSNFYVRCLFGIVGIAALLVGSACVLPVKESERLEAEIKKRTIIQEGVDAEMKKHAMIRNGAAKTVP